MKLDTKKIIIAASVFGIIIAFLFAQAQDTSIREIIDEKSSELDTDEGTGLGLGTMPENSHPLSIESLRYTDFPGSDIVIEETLTPGSNYNRYVATYTSEGLKIYGLLTIPQGEVPEGGWPAVIFNHGYIAPEVYRTTEKYVAYQDAFAREGYVTFKSDYRGHGISEGVARGGYGSNDYTIDVLNGMTSVQNMEEVNPDKIGMWGHSMGGHITLESMVVRDDIKVGVIWAGVVGSYQDIFERWRRRNPDRPSPSPGGRGWWRTELAQEHGEPEENPEFWNSLAATTYITDVTGPIQLHHGTADSSVDVELSINLHQLMQDNNLTSELFTYEGDDHNISNNLRTALNRSVAFFDEYLK